MKRSMQDYTLAGIPEIGVSRSRFNAPFSHTTTFNQGELVPLAVKEILPGDTFSFDLTSFVRMSTPVFPVMDNAKMDVFAFWVPNRLVWDHWKNFIGENTSGPWAPNVEYTIPQLKYDYDISGQGEEPYYGAKRGSLANHLYHVGCLPGGNAFSQSDLPNRGYRLIWNEFFRSEAYQNPIYVPTDDQDRSYHGTYSGSDYYGDTVLRANRLPDYFSLVLPAPQNGAPVSIPVSGLAPVITSTTDQNMTGREPLHFRRVGNNGEANGSIIATNAKTYQQDNSGTAGASIAPSNLYANLAEITGNLATINELRTAFQIQKLLQAYQAGRRYREVLSNVFNVNIPDSTVQVPEYLGGCEFDINISQVVQTSSTDATSPQGNVAAYSMSIDKSHLFSKSFVEHGMVFVLGVVRVRHTYANAVDPSWNRKRLLDFYFPQFANISDQPVKFSEFCPTGDATMDDTIFGYKEAWAEYRQNLNSVSGDFTPDMNGSSLLSAYTFADYNYWSGLPLVAYPEWLEEPDTNVSQTLAVKDSPQFIANFYLQCDEVRPMPVHSVPGLADHH